MGKTQNSYCDKTSNPKTKIATEVKNYIYFKTQELKL